MLERLISSNSEAFVSKLLENHEEMFPRYWLKFFVNIARTERVKRII